MATTRPPKPEGNYSWSELLQQWLPNDTQFLKNVGSGAIASGLNTILAPLATSGAAKQAVQEAAAESLASKILANKTAIIVGGVAVVGLIVYLATKKRA